MTAMRVFLISNDTGVMRDVWRIVWNDYDFELADTGEESIALIREERPDLVILDPRIPDMSGPDVMRRLRADGIKAPVLVVSDQAGVEEMSRGFGFGADGTLTTPFRDQQLVDAMHAATGLPRTPAHMILEMGGLRLNLASRKVTVDGQRAPMSESEFRVLELLVRAKGEVVTKEAMQKYVHGHDGTPGIGVIDVFVSHMRKILTAAYGNGHNYVERVWGTGYRLVLPEPDSS